MSYIKARVLKTDPRLASITTLNGIASNFEVTLSEIQNFASNGSEAHLGSATDQLDNALSLAGSLPPLAVRAEADALMKAAADNTERLQGLESSVRERMRGLMSEIEQQKQAIQPLGDRLEAVQQAADAKTQETAAQMDQKLAEVRTEIDSQKARLDDAIKQYQEQFGAAQETRRLEFSSHEQERETSFKGQTDKLIQDSVSKLDATMARANESMASLQEQERHAAEIVGVTAAAGVAGAFKNEAAEQRSEADKWRLVAFATGLVLLAGSIIVGIAAPPDPNMAVTEIFTFSAIRLSVAGVLAGAFYYAISQSAEHRRRERSAKLRAMQLTAFRPFLAELSPQERSEEIRKAAPGFFAPEPDDPRETGDK